MVPRTFHRGAEIGVPMRRVLLQQIYIRDTKLINGGMRGCLFAKGKKIYFAKQFRRATSRLSRKRWNQRINPTLTFNLDHCLRERSLVIYLFAGDILALIGTKRDVLKALLSSLPLSCARGCKNNGGTYVQFALSLARVSPPADLYAKTCCCHSHGAHAHKPASYFSRLFS